MKFKPPIHARSPTTANEKQVFFLVDGDSVGDRLQLLLLDNELGEAERFSTAISSALLEIKELLMTSGAHIFFVGGDELLGSIPEPVAKDSLFSEIRAMFHSRTGCTLSVGVGEDPRGALESLQRAKLSGRNKIVGGRQ